MKEDAQAIPPIEEAQADKNWNIEVIVLCSGTAAAVVRKIWQFERSFPFENREQSDAMGKRKWEVKRHDPGRITVIFDYSAWFSNPFH